MRELWGPSLYPVGLGIGAVPPPMHCVFAFVDVWSSTPEKIFDVSVHFTAAFVGAGVPEPLQHSFNFVTTEFNAAELTLADHNDSFFYREVTALSAPQLNGDSFET